MIIILNGIDANIAFMFVILLIGFFTLILSKNMVRMIIGIELMARASTFLFVYYGYVQGKTGLSQALVVTIILVEVVVTAIALALIVNIFKLNGSLNTKYLNRLKG